MRDAFPDADYNPSSLYAEGRRARSLLDDARERIAAALGASRNEIVLTASGTEANNEALFGVAAALHGGARFVASAIEHHAVIRPLARLTDEGFQTALLPVDSNGFLDPQAFGKALVPETAVASVIYANNEIGTVQPIAELASIARNRGAIFHTDAVQAPVWLPIDVRELGVDLMSVSAHKFGGPKGIGALYVRRGVALRPLILGGGQEFGRRAGTENVAGAVGMAAALELAAAEAPERRARVAALRDRLEQGIRSQLRDVLVNGAGAPRLANVLSVSLGGVDSAALLIALDLAGVAVSAGSACTSGSLEPSHVLQALGMRPESYRGAIRFSLGAGTEPGEIERVLSLLPPIVERLRSPSMALRGDG